MEWSGPASGPPRPRPGPRSQPGCRTLGSWPSRGSPVCHKPDTRSRPRARPLVLDGHGPTSPVKVRFRTVTHAPPSRSVIGVRSVSVVMSRRRSGRAHPTGFGSSNAQRPGDGPRALRGARSALGRAVFPARNAGHRGSGPAPQQRLGEDHRTPPGTSVGRMLLAAARERRWTVQLRPVESTRCVVPARGGRREPHAHCGYRDLRRASAAIRRRRQHGPRQAPPGTPLSAGGPLRALRHGSTGVGRRPALQHRLPPPSHRAAGSRWRGRAAGTGRPRDGAAARPGQAPVGDLDGGGARGRALGPSLEDPSRPRGRGVGDRSARRAHGHDTPTSPPLEDDWNPRPAPSGASLAIGAATDLARSPYEQLRAVRASTQDAPTRPARGPGRWPAGCPRWPA